VKRRVFISLVGSMAAASLAAHAQVPAMAQQTQTVTANLPQIEVMRVKPVEPADFRFRLRDGLVDLMKDFSLSSSQGIGVAWETPAYIAPADSFDERYGRW
jgi:hypothetical protein